LENISVFYDYDRKLYLRLASSLVYKSIKDIKDRGQSGHHALTRYRVPRNKQATTRSDFIASVLWLGSKRATFWFEAADLDQEDCLSIIAWPLYAQAVLDDPECELTEEEEELLEFGIDYLPAVTYKAFLKVNGHQDSVISYLCPDPR